MSENLRVAEDELRWRVFNALTEAGADATSAEGTTRALLHASRIGIDSHGVRLAAHYARMLRSGRVNPCPRFRVKQDAPSAALLDADDGLGHAAAYAGMELACRLARDTGVGAVGIVRSSHFGAAGVYALAGAETGMVALATTNADRIVALHGGSRPFHGTNPIAVAAPVAGADPWLMELATSSIPFNRIVHYRRLGRPLPEGVAADRDGHPTTDPNRAETLIPLGGLEFGHKGAGLAGLVTVLSAVLTGATLDHEMIPMFATEDFRTPRNVGHFCLALDPARFAGRAGYDQAMRRYLAALRGTPARPGEQVLAPGDRESETGAERARAGIPVDPETAAFLKLDAPAASARA